MGRTILQPSMSAIFGITRAVQDISISIEKGEIRWADRENGSGKSTFVSMLCGIHSIDNGPFSSWTARK